MGASCPPPSPRPPAGDKALLGPAMAANRAQRGCAPSRAAGAAPASESSKAPSHLSLLGVQSFFGSLAGKSESCEPSAVYNQRSICLKRAEGPYKLRVQITFGAARPTALPAAAALAGRGLSALRGTSRNPVVAWGLFNFSHVSLAPERGSLHLCCSASRPPAPRPDPAAADSWRPVPGPAARETPTLGAVRQHAARGLAPRGVGGEAGALPGPAGLPWGGFVFLGLECCFRNCLLRVPLTLQAAHPPKGHDSPVCVRSEPRTVTAVPFRRTATPRGLGASGPLDPALVPFRRETKCVSARRPSLLTPQRSPCQSRHSARVPARVQARGPGGHCLPGAPERRPGSCSCGSHRPPTPMGRPVLRTLWSGGRSLLTDCSLGAGFRPASMWRCASGCHPC